MLERLAAGYLGPFDAVRIDAFKAFRIFRINVEESASLVDQTVRAVYVPLIDAVEHFVSCSEVFHACKLIVVPAEQHFLASRIIRCLGAKLCEISAFDLACYL